MLCALARFAPFTVARSLTCMLFLSASAWIVPPNGMIRTKLSASLLASSTSFMCSSDFLTVSGSNGGLTWNEPALGLKLKKEPTLPKYLRAVVVWREQGSCE